VPWQGPEAIVQVNYNPILLFGAYPNHIHITIIVKKLDKKKKKENNSTDRD
jgi:hypothetical protein